MEFLVHNISHSDLVVELSWLRDDDAASPTNDNGNDNGNNNGNARDDHEAIPRSLLARPKFSLVQQISMAIMDRVEELRATDRNEGDATSSLASSTATAPVIDRSNGDGATVDVHTAMAMASDPTVPLGTAAGDSTSTPGDGKVERPAQLHPSMLDIVPEPVARARRPRWKAKCQDTQSPIGFRLHERPVPVTDLSDFRLRGGQDTLDIVQKHWTRVGITAVYFPLIALLLPKWLQVLREFKSDNSKQLVYLISGAGIPRNVAHNMQGNSTETMARLIGVFVRQYYPRMEVFQVHSGSNIFRFDDNVQFMTRELRPCLEAHRETIVERSGEAWRSHFHVTIAYADGPPARLSALNASLRIFRPSYLHVWQLKTFWHERKLSMQDVDFHAFENIEASPCVAFADADEMTRMLVREMREFRDQFLEGEGVGEVASFWLRKSRKPVLAVLVFEKVDAMGVRTLTTHRGMNCEVSMPTGSLCAERNAIGSALAMHPTLRRHSLKMIGVLGLNLASTTATTLTATTTTTSISVTPTVVTRQRAQQQQQLTVVTADSTAVVNDTAAEGVASESDATTETAALARSPSPSPLTSPLRVPVRSPLGKRASTATNANLSSVRKPKRPRTFSCDQSAAEAALQSDQLDRNPLAPCGACKEWLLKIAEANPSFRVVTFESARCRSFYINQIM